ncbi:MAG TPA: hypothetical protein PKO09_17410 [Anaerolineae bacterium]|nr:hypothetical protein [Anaerolineae bacterium]
MTEEQKPTSDIVAELRLLGQQIGSAAKALWESDESRSVRHDIREGLEEAGRQIDTAVRSIHDSDAGRKLETHVKETVEKARESEAADKFEQGIVSTLRDVNRELSRIISNWSGEGPKETPPQPPAGPEGSA